MWIIYFILITILNLLVYLLILTNKYIYNLKCQIVIGKIDFSYFINFSNYQILKNIND